MKIAEWLTQQPDDFILDLPCPTTFENPQIDPDTTTQYGGRY